MIAVKNTVVPRLFDLLPKHEQDEIKRHVLAVMALVEQRKQPQPDYTPDIAPLPPKAKKKISAAQHAAFYSQLNTYKQRTGVPEIEVIRREDDPKFIGLNSDGPSLKIVAFLKANGPSAALQIADYLERPGDHRYVRVALRALLKRGTVVATKVFNKRTNRWQPIYELGKETE